MTLFEILSRFGTAALLRFVALVLAFLALHLLRTPLQIAVWLLTALMTAVDRSVAARLATGPVSPRPGPVWTRGATA
ncbi:MAG TPA: hypothetical protein VHX38_13605 [Pseudonocardiaceae bacterium]|nr:hypothetical protein [Pseudonocardiaceae bacterium]